MNEHASQIDLLDMEIERIAKEMGALWADFTEYGEYGDFQLTVEGRKRMNLLVAEMKKVRESANAAYRV